MSLGTYLSYLGALLPLAQQHDSVLRQLNLIQQLLDQTISPDDLRDRDSSVRLRAR